MTQFYVKELSKLTHISVQTLHHYDRIGLLKPSLRLANGYRLYSEKDLLKLQQIIALKFVGCELSQINKFLSSDVDMIDQFFIQSQLLEKKAHKMLEASSTLKHIASNCGHDKSIPWGTIIELIEIYHMTEQLEKTWIGKILNQDELKKYARFEQDLKARFTESERAQLEQDRVDIINQIKSNLDKDPTSDFGIDIAKRGMDWSNNFYDKKYAALRASIWEKGFQTDHINQINLNDSASLSPESVAWMDKAIKFYYRRRILHILKQIEVQPHEEILKLWEEVIMEMYGDNLFLKNEFISIIMKDDEVSSEAKNWLKKISTDRFTKTIDQDDQ